MRPASFLRTLGRAAAWSAAAGLWSQGALALDRETFIRMGASVLKIEVIREQGGYALGSGVVVAEQKVVTNCHVTRQARAITVIKHGQRWPAQAQAVDAKHDLCVLQVDGIRSGAVELGQAGALRVGQRLTGVGYTGGVGLQSSEGDVVGLYRLDGAPVIQSTNWFTSGASGGGLFDEAMRLVGILTFRMRGGEAHYFAAPVEWLDQPLREPARFEPIQPIEAAETAYWQQPADAQPEFLQAASLAHAGRWAELKALALRWTQAAPQDPNPWYARGMAEESLDRLPDALDAFERSVAADPAFASGWLRLGLVRVRLGHTDRAREALRTLRALSAGLAAQLAERIGPD